MLYRLLADTLVVVHLFFILFVLLGGGFALRWPRLAWIHLPAVFWAALVEAADWVCPLTPLENRWRRWGGEAGYESGFVENYLLPVIYPAHLTRGTQLGLAMLIVIINVVVYARLLLSRRQR